MTAIDCLKLSTPQIFRKRIGWLCDFTLEESVGGAELSGRDLVKAGLSLGFDVREYTPRCGEATFDWAIVNNIRFFTLYALQFILKSNFIYCCRDPLFLPIHQQLFDAARHIFFLSPKQRDLYIQHFAIDLKKVSICPPPIDPTRFYATAKEEIAVAIADLNVHKGIENIIQVAVENPHLQFALYGKKHEDFVLPQLPNLQYYGVVPYDRIPHILAKAKFFIHLPVWLECFGRSVLEAYCSECKLIVNENVGALSFPWNWEDRAAVKDHLQKAPHYFWRTVAEVIERNS